MPLSLTTMRGLPRWPMMAVSPLCTCSARPHIAFRISNKQIAKFVGLAPLADDNGKRQGKRHTRGERSNVGSLLFLIGDIARKCDQSITDFRNRLLTAGKPKMVVRIALAHKLLVRRNAKAREIRAVIALQA